MSEVLLAVVALAAIVERAVASRDWSRERARLVAAVVAPTPAATSAVLDPAPAPRRDEASPRRSTAIGNGGL